MSETNTESSNIVGQKLESGTAHAKAALDETTAAAKEVLKVGKERAQTAISSSKEHLSQAAKDIGEAASAKYQDIRGQVGSKAQEYKGRAQEAYGTATNKARGVQSDTEQFIRDNPLQAIGIAAAAGFVLGLIMRR
jgi:ElaB/YqjD/DUF883 family membrane-anchored ribosome-binding protein